MLPYGNLASILCAHVTGDIFGVVLTCKCMFSLESTIPKLSLVGKFGGVSIL